MNKQSLIVYNLPTLFNILNEIKDNLNFDIFNFNDNAELVNIDNNKYGNYLILTQKNIESQNLNKLIILEKVPVRIDQLLDKININLIKQKYNFQSEINVKNYIINLNTREMFGNNKTLKLTEKEIEIILFLNESKSEKTITDLKKQVWHHKFDLETHTVETHIYRLRKKINDLFKNNNFIESTKNGYKIN